MKQHLSLVLFLIGCATLALTLPSLAVETGQAQAQPKRYQCASSTSRKNGLAQLRDDANARAAQGWRMVNFTATGLNPVTFHACYER